MPVGSKTGGQVHNTHTQVHCNGRVGGVWVEDRDGDDEKMGKEADYVCRAGSLAFWQRPQWPLWPQAGRTIGLTRG